MKDFNKLLNEQIDKLDDGYISSVMNAHNSVKETEAILRSHKETLDNAIESLNAYLGLEIRKRMPKLEVSLSNGKCNVKYRSKALTISPNVAQGKWEIEPTDMGRGFVRGFSDALPLHDNMGSIADAAIQHFSNNYKTIRKETGMGEDVGTGGMAIGAGRSIKQRGKSAPGNLRYEANER